MFVFIFLDDMSSNCIPVASFGIAVRRANADPQARPQSRPTSGGGVRAQMPSPGASCRLQLASPASQGRPQMQLGTLSTQHPTSSDACATITQCLMMYHTVNL